MLVMPIAGAYPVDGVADIGIRILDTFDMKWHSIVYSVGSTSVIRGKRIVLQASPIFLGQVVGSDGISCFI